MFTAPLTSFATIQSSKNSFKGAVRRESKCRSRNSQTLVMYNTFDCACPDDYEKVVDDMLLRMDKAADGFTLTFKTL